MPHRSSRSLSLLLAVALSLVLVVQAGWLLRSFPRLAGRGQLCRYGVLLRFPRFSVPVYSRKLEHRRTYYFHTTTSTD